MLVFICLSAYFGYFLFYFEGLLSFASCVSLVSCLHLCMITFTCASLPSTLSFPCQPSVYKRSCLPLFVLFPEWLPHVQPSGFPLAVCGRLLAPVDFIYFWIWYSIKSLILLSRFASRLPYLARHLYTQYSSQWGLGFWHSCGCFTPTTHLNIVGSQADQEGFEDPKQETEEWLIFQAAQFQTF